jgi:short-subunit dehydrogenase
MDISILINNYEESTLIGRFQQIPINEMFAAYRANVLPALFLTKYVLSRGIMREKGCLIVNISSNAALRSLAFHFIYGAAKVIYNCDLETTEYPL